MAPLCSPGSTAASSAASRAIAVAERTLRRAPRASASSRSRRHSAHGGGVPRVPSTVGATASGTRGRIGGERAPLGRVGRGVPQQLRVRPGGPVVARLLRRPVHRHHEVVAGAGHRHVEQPQLLVEVHLLVDRRVALELLGRDPGGDAQRVRVAVVGEAQLHAGGARLRLGGHARHDRHRELEPLGAVDGEDADRVVVGLGQHRLDDACPLAALEVGPGEEVAQAATLGLRERARLLDHEPHAPPQVARSAVGEADLEHAPLAHDAVEQLAGRQPETGVVPPGEHPDRVADRVVGRQRLRQGALVVPAAAVLHLEGEEVVVAAPEQRVIAARSRARARRWGRRPPAARRAGRGSRVCCRPATTSPPGTGCRRRRARPRAGRARCAPGAARTGHRVDTARTARSRRWRAATPASPRAAHAR